MTSIVPHYPSINHSECTPKLNTGSERAREAAHGGEAVPVLAVRGQLHLDARHRAAHARRPRRRAQGRQARVVQEDGEAAIQVIQGCREVQ